MIARHFRLVETLAGRIGTPFYFYDGGMIYRQATAFRSAFAPLKALVCYAVKANANLAILKLLAKSGCGADVVSGGELYVARHAGISPKKIVFAGVGKTPEEIREALKAGILMFNVESLSEARAIHSVAKALGTVAEIAVRVNPDVKIDSHHYISTGKKETKFGIALDEIFPVMQAMRQLSSVRIVGLHAHIGSQIVSAAPFKRTVVKLLSLKVQLAHLGILIRRLDLGGGLGIRYDRETPQTAAGHARWLVPMLRSHRLEIVMEPGRFLVGNAGMLVVKVLYRKQSHKKKFLIVDAGMNDLIRPSLYDAYHEIVPLNSKLRIKNSKFEVVDVVGPVCESSDFFAKDRRLPVMKEGEYLAILGTGAYGYSMASNYNMRRRPAEVMVEKGRWRLIRKRETYQDLLRGQR